MAELSDAEVFGTAAAPPPGGLAQPAELSDADVFGAPAPPAPTLGHKLGLGVRDVIEGVAAPLYDLAATPLQAAGLPVHSFAENMDALGFPTANTPGERMASAIVQPAASTLTGNVIGRMMSAAGAAVPLVKHIGEALTAQPVTQAVAAGTGGGVTEATGSPTLGLAASMATPFAAAPLRKVISPNILANTPERDAFRATAAQEDIPMSLAQQTGGRTARGVEATLADLPSSSGVQAAENATQQKAWNAAVLRRAGIDATTATPDVLNAGKADLVAKVNDLTARNTLTADPQFTSELGAVTNDVSRYAAPGVKGPLLNRIADVASATQGGTMSGRAYQEFDSALGKQIRQETDGATRGYLGDLRDTLRGAMDRSISPEDQAAWRDFRTKYAILQTIAKAMDRPSEGTAMGDISPAALAQASRNAPSKSFAFGRGALDDLSRLGQGALKQTIPNSGTPQRAMLTNLLQGKSLYPAVAAASVSGNPLYLLAPAAELGLPYAAAKVYHSNPLASYLTNDVATAPLNKLLFGGIAGQNELTRQRTDGPRRVNPLLPF